MNPRFYTFHSVWELPASKQKVWQTLSAQPFAWQNWWPELNGVRDMKLIDGLSGTSFSCTWQAPIGYRLKSDVTIGKVVKLKQVRLHSSGDVYGTVVCRLSGTGSRTKIKFEWQVSTTKAWMNYLAPLLGPLFAYNHHAVMRSGERGLRDYLLL